MPLAFTFVCFLAVAVYWTIAAVGNKDNVHHEPSVARCVTSIVPVLSYGLLYVPLPLPALHTQVFPASVALQLIGCLGCVAGLGFAVWARWTIGRNWSNVASIKEHHELIETGPYRWVRHPIYSGLLLFVISTAIVQGKVQGLAAIVVLVLGLGWKIAIEERLMKQQFPSEYAAYEARVKRLIPFVF